MDLHHASAATLRVRQARPTHQYGTVPWCVDAPHWGAKRGRACRSQRAGSPNWRSGTDSAYRGTYPVFASPSSIHRSHPMKTFAAHPAPPLLAAERLAQPGADRGAGRRDYTDHRQRSASSPTTASAASRRPTRSRRSRAASTSRTRTASTSATGTPTSTRTCTTARTSRWTSTAATRPPSATSATTSARIYYYYPGTGADPAAIKIDNTELYIGGSWGPFSLKYSYAVTDFFGAPDSKGAGTIDRRQRLHDFGNGFGVNGHVGYQGG